MFGFFDSHRQDDRTPARRTMARRPLVEDLEGRRLLSGLAATPDVQKVREAVITVTPDVQKVREAVAVSSEYAATGKNLDCSTATPAIIAIL